MGGQIISKHTCDGCSYWSDAGTMGGCIPPVFPPKANPGANCYEQPTFLESHTKAIQLVEALKAKHEASERELGRVRDALRVLALTRGLTWIACAVCGGYWFKNKKEDHNLTQGHICPAQLPEDHISHLGNMVGTTDET